ncbi:MAG: NifU family protein [Deltaproteobacteria bacterium]|nr:MAG: NifU family protein [Deltaproteobacteria bacterium]
MQAETASASPHPHEAEIEAIPIHSVPTPNPDALMFRVEEALVPTGTFEYSDAARAADESPLAHALLSIGNIELVLIAPRFVTVRKEPRARWPDLVPRIKRTLREFIWSGEMAVFDVAVDASPPDRSEVEQRIIALLDEEIRPAIAQDGGDVTYMGFVDGVVQLRMIGACGTCPSSTATLKMGIEALLCEEIPEVRGVEQV